MAKDKEYLTEGFDTMVEGMQQRFDKTLNATLQRAENDLAIRRHASIEAALAKTKEEPQPLTNEVEGVKKRREWRESLKKNVANGISLE